MNALRSVTAILWLFTFAARPQTTDLFSATQVHRISIQLSSTAFAQLKISPRTNVPCLLSDSTGRWTNVLVHLKGATGSFQSIDRKPSFTMSFGHESFHGLKKVHLNNSVEDSSFANELLGSDAFRAAGIPAQRVTHAVVTLNEKRLGIYVLKEGFTPEVIAASFTNTGQLFEPGAGHDVSESLDAKFDVNTTTTLSRLAVAIAETNLSHRWQRLEQALDVDAFAKFLALEVLLAHRDGYALARNNYRIFQPQEGSAVFLPAGMDQLFGRAPSMLDPRMSGAAARAFIETPEGRGAYHRELATLFPTALNVKNLQERIKQIGAKLKPACTRAEWKAWTTAAEELKADISTRQRLIAERLR